MKTFTFSNDDENPVFEKHFNHVSIDRFTGGARAGALFTEKTVSSNQKITLNLIVETSAFEEEWVEAAFEAAIGDLKNGRLPLGGSVAKGHGVFLESK